MTTDTPANEATRQYRKGDRVTVTARRTSYEGVVAWQFDAEEVYVIVFGRGCKPYPVTQVTAR